MDDIFHEEEQDSRFSTDTAFLKHYRLPDQVQLPAHALLCRMLGFWTCLMDTCSPKVSLLPAPC